MKILAGIITYNPDLDRLRKNIESVITQVDEVLVVDNDSSKALGIKPWLTEHFPNVRVIYNTENLGVATALNQELQFGFDNGYDWVLQLDQDTVIPNNLASEYKKYILFENVAMICPKIDDVNAGIHTAELHKVGYEYTGLCITSGSMLKVDVWKSVGGYCDEMFIDEVDYDFCMTLIEHGFKIIKCFDVLISHEVGCSKYVRNGSNIEMIHNEKPFRYYYIFRNGIYKYKRHKALMVEWYGSSHTIMKQWIKKFILINLYETDIFKKDYMIFKGTFHALTGRYGKL